MLFFIVTLGNMLGNVLETFKNHWELKQTPSRAFDNVLGTLYEH